MKNTKPLKTQNLLTRQMVHALAAATEANAFEGIPDALERGDQSRSTLFGKLLMEHGKFGPFSAEITAAIEATRGEAAAAWAKLIIGHLEAK